MFIQQILKDLFREKTRMVLTILAIAWGTFAIASMLAVGEGLRVTFAETMANTGHNLLTFNGGRVSESYKNMRPGIKINLTKKDYQDIAKLPNIAAISKQYTLSNRLIYKDKVSNMNILAVNSNYNLIHEIKVETPGRFLLPLDIKNRGAVIVLGEKTATEFFPKGDAVGKYVNIGSKPFLIIGVMQHKSQMMARRGQDASNNWIPVSTYELYANPKSITSIDLTYEDPLLLDNLKSHIQQIVAINHGASPNDDNLVHFSDFAAREERVNTFFLGMQIFLGIIGTLTLIVAGVGIANVMFASINRATHEIGIRMALGARTYHILWHYITEAITASFLGGIIGLSGAYLLVYGLRKIPMKGRLIDAIGQPKPVLSITVILLVILVLGIIGLLAGLFPAIKATKVDPAEALSYE